MHSNHSLILQGRQLNGERKPMPYHTVYDPRGTVNAVPKPLSGRVIGFSGIKLGILDNTKWNGNKLLRKIVAELEAAYQFEAVNYYRKESFSMTAADELISEIVNNNDIVITAIGD